MRTPDAMSFDLHLPAGTKDVFLARVKTIPEEKRTLWRFHTVKPGESLGVIATNFHARPAEIAETNDLAVTDAVNPGDELVIPVATAASAAHAQFYTVRRGDTLVTVADRFNVSVEDLRRWNHLQASAVSQGRRLQVSEPVHRMGVAQVRGRKARDTHASIASDGHGAKGHAGKGSGSRESRGDAQRAVKVSKSSQQNHVEKTSLHSAGAASKHAKKAAR
jgi:membrane-bound lytic murein transglycosylase D